MMTDPIADMLTRIRNGQMSRAVYVPVPYSKFKEAVLKVLIDEGFLEKIETQDIKEGIKNINIYLKYFDGEGVIKEIEKVSKPGCRVYSKAEDIPKFRNGLGINLMSTPKGVISDYEARKQNVGGEVICRVY